MANKSLAEAVNKTRKDATKNNQDFAAGLQDWRVRLSLAPRGKYLYNADEPGILQPLKETNGVIFPYTPSVSVQYSANYDTGEIIHSNYKIYQYKNSSVDNIQITGEFTAQDTYEANYVLAVIHFFKSMTKMFYGQDKFPKNGTPPPLCYVYGLGTYQFDKHPIAVTGFTYNLPNDVDYIRASAYALTETRDFTSSFSSQNTRINRLNDVAQGGVPAKPKWTGDRQFNSKGNEPPTYVPTKIQLSITAIPIVSRLDISNRFSLENYSSGKLLRGSDTPSGIGGGLW